MSLILNFKRFEGCCNFYIYLKGISFWSIAFVMYNILTHHSHKSLSGTGVTSDGSGFSRIIWLSMAGKWYPWSLLMLGALSLICMASFTFLLCQLDSQSLDFLVLSMDHHHVVQKDHLVRITTHANLSTVVHSRIIRTTCSGLQVTQCVHVPQVS